MGTTEIRVHGVADRGPEAMLDRPIVSRVAGDRDAGFYQVRPGFGDPHGAGGATLEAYSWSRLAGGTATRTFSLVLLLPFMLANIAIWMLPPGRRTGLVGKALCRLLAATLTAMYVPPKIGGHQFAPDTDFDRAVEELVRRLHPAGNVDGGLRE
ncbi:hypothetical protein [Micromonospora inositola]|uniref:Uncharacterized protein n=1 Tax=Micromonospora inositola TaxID=47865 RepID=A0A1C5I5U6_9ACTN|nr:hypothetical protein [Micromonospora inositola]SCG53678.1 hypothetical protein GA0070613_2309 [Micromonospora inositola]